MKIYLKLPGGTEFRFVREPREPMESDKFFALVALAAGALVVVLLLGGAAL